MTTSPIQVATEHVRRGLHSGDEPDPEALRDYPEVPLYVHENGAAFDDMMAADGTVHDPNRRGYIAHHIDVVRARVREDVDVRGHFARSLLDNFEWAEGYKMRFGIVHVDFATQRRRFNSSAQWDAKLIKAHHDEKGST